MDYITISSSLLFSGKYAKTFDELKKSGFYARNIKVDGYDASGYLNGVDVVSMDYRELFNRYKDHPNAVFLMDPPYLSTDVSSYENYWRLNDYLEVLDLIRDINYVYFTSNKSMIVDLCSWMGKKSESANPFFGAKVRQVNANVSGKTGYIDIMMHNLPGVAEQQSLFAI